MTLGGVRLPNPLILSSMYYDPEILGRAMGLGCGGGHGQEHYAPAETWPPEPNLVRVSTPAGPGLVSCNGFRNPGLDAYRRMIAAMPHRGATDRGRSARQAHQRGRDH